jgi:hypothetical protein
MTTETTAEATIETTIPSEQHILPNLSDLVSEVQEPSETQPKVTTKDSSDEERKQKLKRTEKAVAMWYATAKGWTDQIRYTALAMARRIEKDPNCVLASIFTAKELEEFESQFSDASTALADFYPLLGKPLLNPIHAMDENSASIPAAVPEKTNES